MVLLAASLDGLEFQPGMPFPGSSSTEVVPAAANQSQSAFPTVAPIAGGVAALLLLALMVYLPLQVLRAVKLKYLWWTILGLAITLILVILLPRLEQGPADSGPRDPGWIIAPPSFDYPLAPIGNPPEVFHYLAIGGVVLIAGVLIYVLYRVRGPAAVEADPVLREVSRASEALDEGAAWEGVVILCYAEMCRLLQLEQGIQRKGPMTAREFQGLLATRGFPQEPVVELTALFEKARYGSGEDTAHDEVRARRSLDEILEHGRKENASP